MKFSMILLGVLLSWLVIGVNAHGRLTLPQSRDKVRGVAEYLQNEPVACPGNVCSTQFVCRNYPAAAPSVTLVAGSSLPMSWTLTAAHEGDCFLYLSYDTDLPDGQKKWFKIQNFQNCKQYNGQTVNALIPNWVKSCTHCILRWDWYALHLIEGGTVEFYSQCVDVSIQNPNGGSLGTPMFTIPGHFPSQASAYRNPFTNPSDTHVVGPALAVPEGSSPQSTTGKPQIFTTSPPYIPPQTTSYNPSPSTTGPFVPNQYTTSYTPPMQTTGSQYIPPSTSSSEPQIPSDITTGSVPVTPGTEQITPPEEKAVETKRDLGVSYIVGYAMAAFVVILILIGALVTYIIYRRRRRDRFTFAHNQPAPLDKGPSQTALMTPSPNAIEHQISTPNLTSHIALNANSPRNGGNMSPQAPVTSPPPNRPFQVGSPVLAQYQDGRFYKGTIIAVRDGLYLVQYAQYPEQEWKSQDKLRSVAI